MMSPKCRDLLAILLLLGFLAAFWVMIMTQRHGKYQSQFGPDWSCNSNNGRGTACVQDVWKR